MIKLENQMVSYNNASDSIKFWSGTTLTDIGYDESNCYEWYKNTWCPYYISYPVYIEKDKFEKAFNIAKLLLKENMLVSRKLKDFIELVEKIAKEL